LVQGLLVLLPAMDTCKAPVKLQASKNASIFVSPVRSHLQKDKGQNQWFVGRHTHRHMPSLSSPWGCHTCLSAVSASSLTLRRSKKEKTKRVIS